MQLGMILELSHVQAFDAQTPLRDRIALVAFDVDELAVLDVEDSAARCTMAARCPTTHSCERSSRHQYRLDIPLLESAFHSPLSSSWSGFCRCHYGKRRRHGLSDEFGALERKNDAA